MPYCPLCLTEYLEAATECADCNVALQPDLPAPALLPREEGEPNARIVPLRLFRGLRAQVDAEVARNLLEQGGIPSNILAGFAAELLPGADAVQLLVRIEDYGRATAILRDFLESDVEQPEGSRTREGPGAKTND